MLTPNRLDRPQPNLGSSAPHHPYRVAPARPARRTRDEPGSVDWALVATGVFLCLWSCGRVAYGHQVQPAWDSEDTFAILVMVGVGALLLRWVLRRESRL